MKRVISIVLALVMMLALAACNGAGGTNKGFEIFNFHRF